MVRAVWSQPPPGAAGTNIFKSAICCAVALPVCNKAAGRDAAADAAAEPIRRRRRSIIASSKFIVVPYSIGSCRRRFLFWCLDGPRLWARIGPQQMPWDRALVALAGLHLFPSMRQRADRAR